MTAPDNTTSRGTTSPSVGEEHGVLGGDANERMDGGNDTVGRGADGDTAAREELRVSLGERSGDAGHEDAGGA